MHSLSDFLLVAALLQAPPAQPAPPAAQAPPRVVDQVIVTASVAPIPVESVSRAVTVLTRQDLERRGITSVIEALRLVPGVDPRARGPRDVQTDFSIRGATFGQSLVLVDGIRLNDSQSGHHNGEVPMALAGLDRIEVVAGGSSATHGADALGGVINVITRQDPHAVATVSAGQHGTVAAQASVSGVGLPRTWTATGWASRSAGFEFDRDFASGGGALRGSPRAGVVVDVRHQRRAFGANGFYGPSPSKEWTDQTLGALTLRHAADAWLTTVRAAIRNHGDHFRWDIRRPGFAENRHRTNAADAHLTAERDLGAGRRLALGAGGGGDWVASSNLGNHRYGRGAAFAEIQWPIAPRALVQGGMRVEGFSRFGVSWNPSVSLSTWLRPALRLRASAAHAFRIPTFTELYYRDPAHRASAGLRPERGWSADGGMDWSHRGWTLSISPFRRWDEDVIDWVRALPSDVWQTTNVRHVTTTGVEGTFGRRWSRVLLQLSFTGLGVDTPELTVLSKYVREYARYSTVGSLALPVGGLGQLSVNFDHRQRVNGQTYDLLSARVSRVVRRAEIFLEGTNLFAARYQEIAGVNMPGRWLMAGVTIR